MIRTFGTALRAARLTAGYTQRDLAAAVEVDHTYLSKLENGRCLPPSARLLHRIARVVNTNEDALLALAGKPSVAALRRRVAELETVLRLCWQPEHDSIQAPEDELIDQLGQLYGYGAVMHSASRMWARRDPTGAHTVGPCRSTVKAVLEGEGA